jgi:hypothetical protein
MPAFGNGAIVSVQKCLVSVCFLGRLNSQAVTQKVERFDIAPPPTDVRLKADFHARQPFAGIGIMKWLNIDEFARMRFGWKCMGPWRRATGDLQIDSGLGQTRSRDEVFNPPAETAKASMYDFQRRKAAVEAPEMPLGTMDSAFINAQKFVNAIAKHISAVGYRNPDFFQWHNLTIKAGKNSTHGNGTS